MISNELRTAIKRSGRSAWQIGQEIKTNPQTIRRFLRGEVGLSQEVADRISELLDLVVVQRGDTPAEVPPPDWEQRLENRAMEIALDLIRQGFDKCLMDRVREWRLGP